jgi:AcrR family transcriptional regulator
VDAVIARAGVAKATFYAHLGSKDALVEAWLHSSRVRWFDGVRSELGARVGSPRERLVLFFDVLGEWLEAEGSAGCQILNAAIETRATDDRPRRALVELQQELEAYFRSAAAEAGIDDPAQLAAQLLLLVPGTIATASARGAASAASNAKAAAERLVAAS